MLFALRIFSSIPHNLWHCSARINFTNRSGYSVHISNFHLFGSSNPNTPVLLKPLCTLQIRYDIHVNEFAFL